MKMKMKKRSKKLMEVGELKGRIKNGLFFKEDFEKLPNGTIIFIKDGFIILNKNKSGIVHRSR